VAPHLDIIMLLNILLVILVIDCVALTLVILLQRSEGGALGMGGGPTGMFTARGAGDLLTRTTAFLTVGFFTLSLGITLLAGHNRATSSITAHEKVNPIDLQALAKQQQQNSQAPAPSSGPAAPPLPGAAPPLPGATLPGTPQPQALAPTQAPRPTASRPAPRPVAGQVGQNNMPSLSTVRVPRPDLNAPPPAPANPAPNQ